MPKGLCCWWEVYCAKSIPRIATGLLLGLVVLVPFSAMAADGAPVTLAYKFKSGQFFHYEMSHQMKHVSQQGEQKFNVIQSNETHKHFRVVSVDDEGTSVLEPVMDKIKLSAQVHDDPPVSFDSSRDDIVPPAFSGVKETLGKPLFRFHVAPNGKLLKVLVIAEDVSKSYREAAERTDPKLNFLIVLPTSPVRIGDKWKENYEVQVKAGTKTSLTQPIPMKKEYELTKVTDGIAEIRFRTAPLVAISDPETQGLLIDKTTSGTIEFDIERGVIRQQKTIINESVINALGLQTALHLTGEIVEKLAPNAGAATPTRLSNASDSKSK